ncbi:MAG: hypothetical protein NT062_06860 [Proteobacteria bacterium]|nr:hypothetical protein [Pseudomonadota bacterium]
MLEGLFVTPAVTAIEEALASAKVTGPIAVIGNGRLARALAGTHAVVAIGLLPRAAKKHAGPTGVLAELAPGSLGAVIGVDASDGSLPEWTRVVRYGGAIITVDSGARSGAANASRRALCGGLTELEQRHAGRLVITSGLVTHL